MKIIRYCFEEFEWDIQGVHEIKTEQKWVEACNESEKDKFKSDIIKATKHTLCLADSGYKRFEEYLVNEIKKHFSNGTP